MDTATTVSRSTSTPPPAQHRLAAERRLFQIAVALILLLPPALLYARAIADALLSVVAILFLANRWVLRDRTWLRPIHIRLSLIFWAWVLLCTVIAGRMHALGEALALVRFFIFAAALEFWVLADARQRRHLQYVILAVAAWIIIESWQQYLLGTNIFGDPRWGSGVLTGPSARTARRPHLADPVFRRLPAAGNAPDGSPPPAARASPERCCWLSPC